MSFPKVVAFDTDWTLWQNYTRNLNYWGNGRHAPRAPKREDNMECTDGRTIRDKTDPQNVWIRVFGDVSRIINDVLKNGAQLAIVGRSNRALGDRALYYFNTINPADGKEWSIIHLVKYDEIYDGPKTATFRKIVEWAQCDPMEILHFDDEAFYNAVRIENAVTFKWCAEKKGKTLDFGMTWDRYEDAVNHWKRVQDIRVPLNPSPPPERRIIAYNGLSTDWIDRVNVKGEGIIDTKFGYRWGYALYMTDDIAMAKFYCGWERRLGKKAFVNEVWVKDYAKWARLNKVWIPENYGPLPRMSNTTWTAERTGRHQESHDRKVDELWRVKTPYVMFCRHAWIEGVPLPRGRRMTEMIVYTQTHRALIEVVQLTDQRTDELIKQNRMPYPIHQRIAEWNITLPQVTKNEEPGFFKGAY